MARTRCKSEAQRRKDAKERMRKARDKCNTTKESALEDSLTSQHIQGKIPHKSVNLSPDLHHCSEDIVHSGDIPVSVLDTFSLIAGLVTPSYLYYCSQFGGELGIRRVHIDSTAVQIHCIPGHFLVSRYVNRRITVYDSMPHDNRVNQIMPQLKALYNCLSEVSDPQSCIDYVVAQFQGPTLDCAAFAAANAALLMSGGDPLCVSFDQTRLREHLQLCLVSKSVTPFPTILHPTGGDALLAKYFTQSIRTATCFTNSYTRTEQRSKLSHVENRSRSAQNMREYKNVTYRLKENNRNKEAMRVRRGSKLAAKKTVSVSNSNNTQETESCRKRRYNQQARNNKLKRLADPLYIVDNFKKVCLELPICVCCICNRTLFRKQVQTFHEDKYENKDLVTNCLQSSDYHIIQNCDIKCLQCANWICITCHRHLRQSNIPPQAMLNALMVSPLPNCLKDLNQLERHLVSPVIPFMKILTLPKTLNKGIHGPVVCVPSNVVETTRVLPRPLHDHTLIKVKLKRKIEYKGHHLFQRVSPRTVNEALHYLKKHNPHFLELNVGHTFEPRDEDDSSILTHTVNTGEVARTVSLLARPIHTSIDSTTEEESNNESATMDTHNITATNVFHLRQHAETDASNYNEYGIIQNNETEVTVNAELDITEQTNKDITEQTNKQHTSDIKTQQSILHETSCPMVSCLQPDDLTQALQDPLINVAPAEGNRPCSVFNIEAKAFPYLFPDGNNVFDEQRNTKLGLNRYINGRLFSADTRFARDPQYIFYSQYLSELKQIQSSISIALRKASAVTSDGRRITANMLIDSEHRKRLIKSDEGYRLFKTIRGTPAFWEKILRDLYAMVGQLGTPTWFCSFSAADRRWPEIVKAICDQQGQEVPLQMDWSTHCQIIRSNPVTACRMFEHRVQSFITHVIKSPLNPIGTVSDYFIRTEFQSRGWPHIHCLFWCSDGPTFKSNSDNIDLINYINKYVTCEMPDGDTDPVLHEIVTNVQMHSRNHSRSCKKGAVVCRFNFPRPPTDTTFIAKPTPPPDGSSVNVYKKNAKALLESIQAEIDKLGDTAACGSMADILRHLNVSQTEMETAFVALSKRNTVYFKRRLNELWVNPYSKLLLLCWNGNMDIQPVLDATSCLEYIVKYVSKSERDFGDLIKRAQDEASEGHTDPILQLRKLGNVYFQNREVSVMEAIYRACGMKLKQCTRDTVFLPSDSQTSRLTKPLAALRNCKDDDDIWMISLIDRYLARPLITHFDNISLADFASQYRLTSRISHGPYQEDSDDDITNNSITENQSYELQHGLGAIAKRIKPAIIRYARFQKAKDSERYYQNLLRVYLPHRTKELKRCQEETYEEMFHTNANLILTNMSKYEKLTTELDAAWQHLHESHEDTWALIASNQEVQRLEDDRDFEQLRQLDDFREEMCDDDIPDLRPAAHVAAPTTTPESTLSRSFASSRISVSSQRDALRQLNCRQRQLFYFVRNWARMRAHGTNTAPFQLFLTGGAGTGKSHLVRCIYHEVCKTLPRESENPDSPVALLVAPTGTAAYNINGQTIHSAFSINRATGKGLPEKQANTLRYDYQDLQLLIIDEISMVSHNLLSTIHSRLQQIKQPSSTNSFFGNLSVLAVGDFYQIPPVMSRQLFLSTNTVTDLWNLFHIWELKEVVRQKGDSQFIDLLNRLRVAKNVDDISEDDEKLLRSRLIHPENSDYPKTALHLYSTNKQVAQHNNAMLHLSSDDNPIIKVPAVDICVHQKNQKSFKRRQPLDTTDTSLATILTIRCNSRVMLSTNVDVKDGLTNGVLGTVTHIIEGKQHGQPEAICVRFDDERVGNKSRQSTSPPLTTDPLCVVIRPYSEVIQTAPYQITRHQFPLKLAWAVTIHKVQGMTTHEIVISLANIFKPGMAYVALSRVTSLAGLFLLEKDFRCKAIYCDQKIASALYSMPLAETLPLWNSVVHPTFQESAHSLVIASHNTEGFLPHLHDFKITTFFTTASVIALQETWLQPHHTISNALPKYNVERSDRCHQYNKIPHITSGFQQAQKGGVALFIKEHLDFNLINTQDIGIECVAVEITSLHMTVINVYRPPQLPLRYFCNELTVLLTKATTTSVLLVGDFNVNALTTSVTVLSDTLQGFVQLINSPTTQAGSLLDHIYVKDLHSIQSGVIPIYYSYHDVTYANIRL